MYEKNLSVVFGHQGERPGVFEPRFTAVADLVASFNRYHPIGFWEYEPAAGVMHWSRETFLLHGLDQQAGEISLRRALAFYVDEDRPKVDAILKKAMHAGQGFHYKLRIKRDDGRICVVEVIGDAAPAERGGASPVLSGSIRDVTSQMRQDNMRIGQKDLLDRLIRSLPIAAVITDNRMRYIVANERFPLDFNIDKGRIVPMVSHFDLFPDTPTRLKELMRIGIGGQFVSRERDVFERADGSRYVMDWVFQPWTAQTGAVGGIIMLFKIHRFFPPGEATSELQLARPPQVNVATAAGRPVAN